MRRRLVCWTLVRFSLATCPPPIKQQLCSKALPCSYHAQLLSSSWHASQRTIAYQQMMALMLAGLGS